MSEKKLIKYYLIIALLFVSCYTLFGQRVHTFKNDSILMIAYNGENINNAGVHVTTKSIEVDTIYLFINKAYKNSLYDEYWIVFKCVDEYGNNWEVTWSINRKNILFELKK